MQLRQLISYYLPVDQIKEAKHKMFGVLYEMLLQEIPASVQGPVVDNLFGFVSHSEDVKSVLKWVKQGSILSPDGAEIFKLAASHKRSIVKAAFKSNELSTEEKNTLLHDVIGDDKSDLAKNTRLTCAASIADAESKEKVWNGLLDPKSALSSKERQAQMAGFYSWDQLDLCRPYFNKFYEILLQLESEHGYKYMEAFFYQMLPRMEIEDSHLVQLMVIKSQVPDTNSMFSNVLQDGIELLLRSKNIREKAAQK